MGQSQSTRSRTPSYRIDQTMGRPKNEDSGAFQPTQTKDASSLDESAGDGFSVPPKHAERDNVNDNDYNKGEEIVIQPSIPTVTVTGN